MVELFPYNSQWPDLFEGEERLIARFGKKNIAIEHIGSTSIPGMLAKPIIDMNVAVASLDDTGMFIQELPSIGYEYMLNRRFHDRYFFPKGPREQRTHHLNLVEISSETGWEYPLRFRDYLRRHADAHKEYMQLKQNLATRYANNRILYTEAKSDFIQSVLQKASG